MAAEFEFDLNYFQKFFAPIKKYISIPSRNNNLETYDPKTYFQIKDSAPKEVKELLGRFEFAWETVFSPPKVEIRHKVPLDPSQVRRDVHALLKLFSRNEAEYQKLLTHLSSIRAETDTQKHLNLHLHASAPLEEERLSLFKKYQLITALELIAVNPEDEAIRVFDSTHSAYQSYPWNKGLGRTIHLERYESRKRAISVDTDITSLENLFSQPVHVLEEAYNHNTNGLITDSVIEKLLNATPNNHYRSGKYELIRNLFLLFPDNAPFKTTLWRKISDNSYEFVKNVLDTQRKYPADDLEKVKLLLVLNHKAPVSAQDRAYLEAETQTRLSYMIVEDQISLLSWISREFNPEDRKIILESPYLKTFNEKFSAAISKIAQFADSTYLEKKFIPIIGINPGHANVEWSKNVNYIKNATIKSPINADLRRGLAQFYANYPIETIRNLNPDQREEFFDLIDWVAQQKSSNMSVDEKELHKQTKRYFRNGSLCKDAL